MLAAVRWLTFHVDSDCSNFRLPSRPGSSGSVSFTDLAPGRYVLRVAATNSKEDRAIERRRFEISSDPSFCTTHLINRGVTVTGDTATVDFTGTGPAETFRCRLDTEPAFACKFSNLHTCTCNHLNPLTTEFFPPRQHIFMHSAHTTFVGTPLPQHSLLSGQTWWGSHTWRDPSGNTVNDIHDPPQAQQSEVKGGCQLDFRPAFP